MKTSPFYALTFLLLVLFPLWTQAQDTAPKTPSEARILVFTHTMGYRHASIEKGVSTLRELAETKGIQITHTEDSLAFNTDNLAQYKLVVFLSTTGNILGPPQEKAFQSYIQNGGSFMGIHAATDTEYDWPWYGGLVGAYFKSHPEQQKATLRIANSDHPAIQGLDDPWNHFDEWYNFRDIQEDLKVLLMLDEKSYTGGENGSYHPIAWFREYDGGRSFYTGLGHTDQAFEDPNFRKHLLGGMLYCLDME